MDLLSTAYRERGVEYTDGLSVCVCACMCVYVRDMCVYRPTGCQMTCMRVYVYIYVYMYVCVCIYIYVYIYVCVMLGVKDEHQDIPSVIETIQSTHAHRSLTIGSYTENRFEYFQAVRQHTSWHVKQHL